jgi:hypothetical protein
MMLFLATAFALGACGELPPDNTEEVQEQPIQRSFYGPGNPNLSKPPALVNPPSREPVPGEQIPDR